MFAGAFSGELTRFGGQVMEVIKPCVSTGPPGAGRSEQMLTALQMGKSLFPPILSLHGKPMCLHWRPNQPSAK